MGAHTAPRTTSVGRVAGRTALTAAAALALTGGTASFAFAGTSSHSDDDRSGNGCECTEKSWDDQHWNDDEKADGKSDDDDHESDGKSDGKSDHDCDDDADRDHHEWDGKDSRDGEDKWDHGEDKWDHGEDEWDHDGDRDHRGTVNGASYGGNHYGDDNYEITNTVNEGVLAGVL